MKSARVLTDRVAQTQLVAIRLRPEGSEGTFFSFDQCKFLRLCWPLCVLYSGTAAYCHLTIISLTVLDVMLHELAHCDVLSHNAAFYRLLDTLHAEVGPLWPSCNQQCCCAPVQRR
jgi:hypothetical protein